MKANCTKRQTIDLELCSIFTFQKWSGTSFHWPNCITWLPILLEISGNIWIKIVCILVCDIISFEIYISFHIKPFSYMTKNSEQKLKYLKNKKSFSGEIKIIFHHFQSIFSWQDLSQAWECNFRETVLAK